MTKEEILEMPARELDALVAEKIMGIKVEYPFAPGAPFYLREDKERKMKWDVVPLYSTDISAAWQVVEKMGIAIFRLNNGDWVACKSSYLYHLNITDDHYADPNLSICKTAPEAICKAALLAIQSK